MRTWDNVRENIKSISPEEKTAIRQRAAEVASHLRGAAVEMNGNQYIGVIRDGNILRCEKCRETLLNIKFVAHADGRSFTTNIYNCAGSGHTISVSVPRHRTSW